MLALKIDEISCVTSPAQEGATVRILKSRKDNDDMRDIAQKAMGSPNPTYFHDFEQAVSHYRKSMSGCDALSAARFRHPTLYSRYQAEGLAIVRKAMTPAPVEKAKHPFELECERVRTVEKCSRTESFARVRSSRPDLYTAYNNG
jgi:hypothetical protein